MYAFFLLAFPINVWVKTWASAATILLCQQAQQQGARLQAAPGNQGGAHAPATLPALPHVISAVGTRSRWEHWSRPGGACGVVAAAAWRAAGAQGAQGPAAAGAWQVGRSSRAVTRRQTRRSA